MKSALKIWSEILVRISKIFVWDSRRQLIPLFDKPAFSRFSQLFQPRIVVHIFGKIVKRQVCQKCWFGRGTIDHRPSGASRVHRVTERACQPCFNGDVHVKLNFRVKMKIPCGCVCPTHQIWIACRCFSRTHTHTSHTGTSAPHRIVLHASAFDDGAVST